MKTVCIQIGNSDNKLAQLEWHKFVSDVRNIVEVKADNIYFQGGCPNDAKWQNYCFVFSIKDREATLKKLLTNVKERYRQENIAYLEGFINFI